MAESNLAWLAGILDGEGCFFGRLRIKKHTHVSFRVEVHVTSQRMVDEIQRIYEMHEIEFRRAAPKMQNMSTRPAHKIVVQKQASLLRLFKLVLPFLIVKDREAEAMEAFLEAYGGPQRTPTRASVEQRVEVVHKLKLLKKIA